MRSFLRYTLPVLTALLLLCSCAAQNPDQTTMKYPRKPADNPERKSGPAMLFYEAAEEDADPNDVIVTPPEQKTQSQ